MCPHKKILNLVSTLSLKGSSFIILPLNVSWLPKYRIWKEKSSNFTIGKADSTLITKWPKLTSPMINYIDRTHPTTQGNEKDISSLWSSSLKPITPVYKIPGQYFSKIPIPSESEWNMSQHTMLLYTILYFVFYYIKYFSSEQPININWTSQ